MSYIWLGASCLWWHSAWGSTTTNIKPLLISIEVKPKLYTIQGNIPSTQLWFFIMLDSDVPSAKAFTEVCQLTRLDVSNGYTLSLLWLRKKVSMHRQCYVLDLNIVVLIFLSGHGYASGRTEHHWSWIAGWGWWRMVLVWGHMVKRGTYDCDWCPLYKRQKYEDVNHLFINCYFTTQVQHFQHSGDQWNSQDNQRTTKSVLLIYPTPIFSY